MTIARLVSLWPWPNGYYAHKIKGNSKRKKRSIEDDADELAVPALIDDKSEIYSAASEQVEEVCLAGEAISAAVDCTPLSIVPL